MALQLCNVEGCTGHLGKFDDCTVEALWTLTLDSGQDDSTGESDGPTGWNGLFIMPAPEIVDVDGRQVTVPAGNYIITEVSTGFVTVSEFDSADLAREEFARLQAANDDDGDED